VPFSIELKGLDQFKKQIAEAQKNVQRVVAAEIKDGALAIAEDAKKAAPADEGFLKNGITLQELNPFNWAIISNAAYSAYIEFGTGSKVQIPPTYEEFAAQYKGGGGSNGSFYEAIKEWVKRKGIDPKASYVIMREILANGLAPHPFFIPAFVKNQPIIIKRIEAALKTI
jgi:HK97 gp10 family phage protein